MQLIIQPEAGIAPVVRAIRKAKSSIAICIFRLDRGEIEQALAAAVQRGVAVSALIAHTNRGGDNALRKLELRLLEIGATVSRTADDLVRYHAKYMIADDVLHVFGFNFTKLDIDKSRSFAIATKDRRAVAKVGWQARRSISKRPSSPTAAPRSVSWFASAWRTARRIRSSESPMWRVGSLPLASLSIGC